MIVITTPTGHIGSKVLAQLLNTDEKLRVIRDLKHELSHHQIQHSTIELESVTMHCPKEELEMKVEKS